MSVKVKQAMVLLGAIISVTISAYSAASQVKIETPLPAGLSTQAKQAEMNTIQMSDTNAQAKMNLRAILARFNQLEAGFVQEIRDINGELLQASKGNVVLQKPQKLKWSVTEPEESILIADGNTVFNIDPFVEQVTLIDQSDLTQNNPLMLLVSDDESQWNGVNIQQEGNVFTLSPVEQNSSIVSVMLTFDEKKRLQRLHSTDKQQQQNVIVFQNLSTSVTISANEFMYATPEGWVVDDQRNQRN